MIVRQQIHQKSVFKHAKFLFILLAYYSTNTVSNYKTHFLGTKQRLQHYIQGWVLYLVLLCPYHSHIITQASLNRNVLRAFMFKKPHMRSTSNLSAQMLNLLCCNMLLCTTVSAKHKQILLQACVYVHTQCVQHWKDCHTLVVIPNLQGLKIACGCYRVQNIYPIIHTYLHNLH